LAIRSIISCRSSGGGGGVGNSSSGGPHVHAAPLRPCVGRHLTNRNEMRVSGSDSYALLFLFYMMFTRTLAQFDSIDDLACRLDFRFISRTLPTFSACRLLNASGECHNENTAWY